MRLVYNMQPSLQTRDMQQTIEFWTDVLGFRLDEAAPEDAPTWCAMHSGNARLMWTVLEPGVQAPELTGRIYLYPDDVETAWAAVKDRAEVLEEPHLTDYGMREFALRDPNGYVLAFGAPVVER